VVAQRDGFRVKFTPITTKGPLKILRRANSESGKLPNFSEEELPVFDSPVNPNSETLLLATSAVVLNLDESLGTLIVPIVLFPLRFQITFFTFPN